MRGLGHRPDMDEQAEVDLECRPARDLVGAASPSTVDRDWRFLSPEVLDQVNTNCCVVFAASESLYMFAQGASLRGTGPTIPRPSIMGGYVNGQLEDQLIDGIPRDERKIVDMGMRARSLLTSWSVTGVASEERWPFNPDELHAICAAPTIDEASKLIPFGADIAAADAKLTGWFRAPSGSMSTTFRQALDQCVLPIFAVDCYQNLIDLGSSTNFEYTGPAGAMIGGHMMLVVGSRPGFLLVKNSWSDGWGWAGYCWIADHVFDGPMARDGWLLKAAPPLH